MRGFILTSKKRLCLSSSLMSWETLSIVSITSFSLRTITRPKNTLTSNTIGVQNSIIQFFQPSWERIVKMQVVRYQLSNRHYRLISTQTKENLIAQNLDPVVDHIGSQIYQREKKVRRLASKPCGALKQSYPVAGRAKKSTQKKFLS